LRTEAAVSDAGERKLSLGRPIVNFDSSRNLGGSTSDELGSGPQGGVRRNVGSGRPSSGARLGSDCTVPTVPLETSVSAEGYGTVRCSGGGEGHMGTEPSSNPGHPGVVGSKQRACGCMCMHMSSSPEVLHGAGSRGSPVGARPCSQTTESCRTRSSAWRGAPNGPVPSGAGSGGGEFYPSENAADFSGLTPGVAGGAHEHPTERCAEKSSGLML
jgi:hypothetical protein